jgi:hypothetical protein
MASIKVTAVTGVITMIGVRQKGPTCWPACVASIFEMPLHFVPDFNRVDPKGSFGIFEHWSRTVLGLGPVIIKNGSYSWERHSRRPKYSIGCIQLPAGDAHAVVVYNGKVVYDPAGTNIRIGYDVDEMYQIFDFWIPTKGNAHARKYYRQYLSLETCYA